MLQAISYKLEDLVSYLINMFNINNLPESLLKKAFIYNNEYAWKRNEMCQIIDILKLNNMAILGMEIWVPENEGVGIIDYGYSLDSRKEEETWNDYINRGIIAALKYIELDQKYEYYFNIEWLTYHEYIEMEKDRNKIK